MDDHTEAERAKNEHIARHHGEYWLDNRSAILDAIEQAGFVLMSNATGFWLAARATLASAPADLLEEAMRLVDGCATACGEFAISMRLGGNKLEMARAAVKARDALSTFLAANLRAPAWKEVEHTAAFITRLDEAIQAAVAALPAQQWVSVAERLPENEQEVLILFNPYGNPANKARVLEAVHTDGGFYDWDDGLELHHPTHWMPKPALQGSAPQHQGGGNGKA